ncbi:MAG: hypothetical protein RI535_06735 [Psychroflexus sp.]|nr:hypothetical protein [Psychroflexus sp.]
MDIKTTKLKLIKAILASDNSNFITRVAEFMNNEEKDLYDELSASEQQEIKQGIDDLDKDKRISYESFLKKIS